MSDNTNRKPSRPTAEKRAIRAIMVELGVKYTTALREYERRKAEGQ